MSDAVSSRPGNRSNNKNDIGWKFCHAPNDGDTNTVVCNYCKKIMKGGITRAKNHLMGRKGDVAACKQCPAEVREELWAYVKKKTNTDDTNYVSVCDSDDDTPFPPSRKNAAELKGPMDLFCRKPEIAISKRKKEQLKQVSIREACDKEATARVHQLIARFWYHGNLSFNLIKHPCFKEMVEGIGSFGPHLRTPSFHEIRVPLLNNEVDYTKNLMADHASEWKRTGCSIMSDAWTDRKQRCIINFLVNSQAGTMFVKSIDASDFVKTGQKLFELLDSLVEEIGEENVVQVITDNGSNYVAAGKLLEGKRPHLYWTPCAAHCIDLMLEDIGKLPLIRKTIKSGINLVGFIYAHSSTLSLLRHFTNKRELVKHAVTRFATSFLSLERIHQEKANLRRMFTSDEWNTNKLSKDAKGKEVTRVVLQPSYWNNVVFTLKVMAPLVRVLRLVDGEKKPAMGYIYEAMDKAKEAIMKSFNHNESKYKDVFEIIDRRWNCQLHRPLHAAAHFLNPEFFYRNPEMEYDLEINSGFMECIKRLVVDREAQLKIMTESILYKTGGGLFGSDFAKEHRTTIAPDKWWRLYGCESPNLQKLAMKILSLTCSASGCERNWSVFEQIHSKKRNRLEHKRLHDLVYVKYNQQLKMRFDVSDNLDPISLDHIDNCNEWLVGEMDDDEDDGAGRDLVFDGDTSLNWDTVYEASGVGEPIRYTRRNTTKRKELSGGGSRTRNSNPKKQATQRKGKEIMVEDEEVEFEDEDEESQEEEDFVDLENSNGEEDEGDALLDDDMENDYVELEEEN